MTPKRPNRPSHAGHPIPPTMTPRGTREQRPERPIPAGLRHIVQPHVKRVRARGTPREEVTPGEQIRTMVFAPEVGRAEWIEGELSRAPISISIQLGRRVRTVVSALVRDPPPRPHVLIVDFDAVSPAELLELHAIRHEGWGGKLIGLGSVPPDLRTSLEIDAVIAGELVRDSLLDCVAGTGHASTTVPIPIEMLATLAPTVRSKE